MREKELCQDCKLQFLCAVLASEPSCAMSTTWWFGWILLMTPWGHDAPYFLDEEELCWERFKNCPKLPSLRESQSELEPKLWVSDPLSRRKRMLPVAQVSKRWHYKHFGNDRCCRDWAACWRILRSSPGFDPFDAKSKRPPQLVTSKNISRHCQLLLGSKIASCKMHCFRPISGTGVIIRNSI